MRLFLNAPPFSINKAHYRNGNRTIACRNWGESILIQLEQYEDDLKKFSDQVKKDINNVGIEVSLTFFMPTLFTKEGKVSRLSSDLSNVEKMLIDLIFDPRFFDKGHVNLNLDDCLIISLHSHKKYSKTWGIEVLLSTIPLNPLRPQ